MIAERTRNASRLRWHLVALCPALEAQIPARCLDHQVWLGRVARKLQRLPSTQARVRVARQIASSIRDLTRQVDDIEAQLRVMVRDYRPQLLAEVGCGTLTAATLIGRTAGAERFGTDAQFARQAGTAPIPVSSGNRQRHRLHRGGDRQLNRALHTIAITRARRDPETRAYLDRKMAEGKTRSEALRCLKRHLARRFHRLLSQPTLESQTTPTMTPPNIACLTYGDETAGVEAVMSGRARSVAVPDAGASVGERRAGRPRLLLGLRAR